MSEKEKERSIEEMKKDIESMTDEELDRIAGGTDTCGEGCDYDIRNNACVCPYEMPPFDVK